MWFPSRSPSMPSPDRALPGRTEPMPIPERHFVNGAPLAPPWPEGTQTAIFALGCFWGAEKAFWTLPGVVSTAVGYAGGYTPNPPYREVCSGQTGHAQAVPAAEDYHQQALVKTPDGYGPHHGAGGSCRVGLRVEAPAGG